MSSSGWEVPSEPAKLRLPTQRLELLPLAAAAAAALPNDRDQAARIIGAQLSVHWPAPDLLDILPMQARATPDEARFGVWVIVERESCSVIGDLGFFGPPGPDGSVEIGYSIVPDRRRRGYATEAAGALLDWVRVQPMVGCVVAGCETDNQASIRTLEHLGFARTGSENGQLRWRLDGERQAAGLPGSG